MEGEQLRFPPSNARLLPRALCLPFSDSIKRPATKGAYPLGTPKHRFSATMFTLEGIRQSRTRGLYEHDTLHKAAISIAGRYLGERHNKHAEFRRAEKVDEEMA